MDHELHGLLSGIQRLGAGANLDEVVRNLASLLRRTVRSRWVLVYFFDRQHHDFMPARAHGLPARYRSLFQNTSLHPEQQPGLRRLMLRKQSLVIAEPATSELLSPLYRKLLAPLSILAVPMVVKGEVTGAILVARDRNLPPFDREETAIVRGMVAHAALLVSHERLFEESLETALELGRRIDIILALDDLSKAITSSLSRTEILETALRGLERVVGSDLLLYVASNGRERTVMAQHSNLPNLSQLLPPGTPLAHHDRLITQVLEEGAPASLHDLARLPHPSRLARCLREAGLRSLLLFPVLGKGNPCGLLLLGDRLTGRYGDDELFTVEKIAAKLSVALDNARLYDELHELFISTVASLSNAIDAKSPWTKGHSERVMQTAGFIAQELGEPPEQVERIRLAGLLHDVGKIGILEQLLESPEHLTDDEFPPLRSHPETGVAILAPIGQLHDILPAIRYHHERFDGSGYPEGLAGSDIPLAARILAVADAYDAMISRRPYKQGVSVAEAMEELHRCAGSQFDPQVVAAFIAYLERSGAHQLATAPLSR